jgi:hypothetical protein
MRAGSHTGITARALLTLVLILYCVAVPGAPVVDKHFQVLVLHSYRHSLPVNTDWYRGIVRAFAWAPDLRIDIEVETLDDVLEKPLRRTNLLERIKTATAAGPDADANE